MKNKISYRLIALFGLLFTVLPAMAQEAAEAPKAYDGQESLMIALTIFVGAVLLLIVATLLYAIIELGKILQGYYTAEAAEARRLEVEANPQRSWWTRLNTKLNDAVPLDREEEVLTDHEYDGIHELDNNLPPWWKALFYGTIVFSVFYLMAFYWTGWLQPQEKEYQAEMLEAKLEVEAYLANRANSIDETNVELDLNEPALAEGSTIFAANCAACHANDLGGGVGPNLTDAYWLHGGDIKSVFKVVKNGVPQKGMISWKSKLTPQQMQRVSSYILSMQGSTPANPKEPQGELYNMNEELEERAIEEADSSVIQ